jgi:uncharacterized protein YjbI with pentapeptide repeats
VIEVEGGTVAAEVTPNLDFLAIGVVKGKSTLAGKKAEQLNAGGQASIRILTGDEFWQLFAPDSALAEALLRAGSDGLTRLSLLCRNGDVTLDLSGMDFRGIQFSQVYLGTVRIVGPDMRQANLRMVHYVHEFCNARLDGATMPDYGIRKMVGCRLVKANLAEALLSEAELEDCDFTRANLEKAHLDEVRTKKNVSFRGAQMCRISMKKGTFCGADFCDADLSKSNLSECNLHQANLTGANLTGADLSQANLRQAILVRACLRGAILANADLTNARIDGADFEDANLVGAKLIGFDPSLARGLEAKQRLAKAGRCLRELDSLLTTVKRLTSHAEVLLPGGNRASLRFQSMDRGKKIEMQSPIKYWGSVSSLSVGLPDMMSNYLHGVLQLESIKVTATGAAHPPKVLKRIALDAWCEACGRPVPSDEQRRTEVAAERERKQLKSDTLLSDLRRGVRGIKRWNSLSNEERRQANCLRGVDLHGCQLDGVCFEWSLDLRKANFREASLVEAKLGSWSNFADADFRQATLDRANLGLGKFTRARFEGASLGEARMRVASFQHARFLGADLTGADLCYAKLQACDLTGATLIDVKLESSEFDEATIFPNGFIPPPEMLWRGSMHDPRRQTPILAPIARRTAPLSFEQFMERLRNQVDAGRLSSALQMLKSERFHLFSEIEQNSLAGVIRSQTSRERVYACRLHRDGSFSCGTQNLRVCGGLGRAICKHLLVLIVGLAKCAKVPLSEVDQWIAASHARQPSFDKDAASALFLRYKGAEAGEVDWRPTETIPEDYYAM